jgi:muramoyltetrapeptide carboxypeptidase
VVADCLILLGFLPIEAKMNKCDRRQFLKLWSGSLLLTQFPTLTRHKNVIKAANINNNLPIKPLHLSKGDTIGLITPGSYIEPEDIEFITNFLTSNGFKYKLGKHIFDRYGYLAGKDSDRAADVNIMFADRDIQAILTTRGGWGCNRILPLLDYNLIRHNPKIIMGYSDITALLLAIYTQTGLITFHGSVGISDWNQFSINYLQKILLNREIVVFKNTLETPIITINSGKIQGRLLGGNLSVITSMIGSIYLPNWRDTILFVEEIGEDIYRVDRMLTQLKLAGILAQISGFIFAQCTNCSMGENNEPSLSLQQVLADHIQPLGIPAWYGSMIGHISNKFTVPIGLLGEIDADQGTIKMRETAVV